MTTPARGRPPPPTPLTLHVTVDESRTVAISAWDGNTLLFSLPEQAIKRGVISIK